MKRCSESVNSPGEGRLELLVGHLSQVVPCPPPAVEAPRARPPSSPQLSLTPKRHVDRHVQPEKRHAGVMAVSQYPETRTKSLSRFELAEYAVSGLDELVDV